MTFFVIAISISFIAVLYAWVREVFLEEKSIVHIFRRMIGTVFVVIGVISFPGSCILGICNSLPETFEWPAGTVDDGAVTTPGGMNVVYLKALLRLQSYDANWKFIRGWHVDGGVLKLISERNGQVKAVYPTGRTYVYDLNGKLLEEETASPSDFKSIPQNTEVIVPTLPWLWPFSSPLIGFIFLVIGVVLGKRTKVHSRKVKKR